MIKAIGSPAIPFFRFSILAPLLSSVCLLNACTSPQQTAEPSFPTIANDTQLHQAQLRPTEERLLDVSIEIFEIEHGLESNAQRNEKKSNIERQAFADISEIERQYLPILLRNTLNKSQYWGTVNVLPKQNLAADLSISGKIIHSDGNRLSLHINAKDASGRPWLDKRYSAIIQSKDNENFQQSCNIPSTPYQQLYHQIANDLLSVRVGLSDKQLLNIRRVAQIHHAQDLSPEAFKGLTAIDSDGLVLVKRLLAHNDPVLQQVERMQNRHYIFVETIDTHYLDLHRKMEAIYQLWQQYSCERAVELELRKLSKDSKKRRYSGGFNAIADNYRRYKISKMFEQEWQQLASSFKQEVDPAVVELNNKVYTLSGSVDQQLEEWRRLLREYYSLQESL